MHTYIYNTLHYIERNITLSQVVLKLALVLTTTHKFVCFDVTSCVEIDCARSALDMNEVILHAHVPTHAVLSLCVWLYYALFSITGFLSVQSSHVQQLLRGRSHGKNLSLFFRLMKK